MRGVRMPETQNIHSGVQFKNTKIFVLTVRLKNFNDSFKNHYRHQSRNKALMTIKKILFALQCYLKKQTFKS
jgi:hypothetical protein